MPMQWVICMAVACLIAGFLAGLMFSTSDSPYAQVIMSYLRLHFWHRVQAAQLTIFMHGLGLSIDFSSPAEQTALTSAVVGVSGLMLGWTLAIRGAIADRYMVAVRGQVR